MAGDRLAYSDEVVQCLASAIAEGQAGLSDVPGLLKKILREDLWRERVIAKTGEMVGFKRFIDFVQTKPLEGLGTDIKTLQRLCQDDKEALDLLDRAMQESEIQGRRNDLVDNVNDVIADSPDGNAKEYALRRLRAQRPDLHEQVLAGDLTPHAAMVAAGFRERTITIPADVDKAARVLARHFDITALIDALARTQPKEG